MVTVAVTLMVLMFFFAVPYASARLGCRIGYTVLYATCGNGITVFQCQRIFQFFNLFLLLSGLLPEPF